MEIPRALQDYLGSGADDAAPCILTIVDGPMRTRSGLQREDDDDGAAPAEDVVTLAICSIRNSRGGWRRKASRACG